MNNEKTKICRLCLKTIYNNDFDAIETITIQMLNVLRLKLDFYVSIDPVMCTDCATHLQNSFDFKSVCISIEDKPFMSTQENGSLNIKQFSAEENVKSCKVCRFCATQTKGCFRYLHETKENIFLLSMLQKHFPELNLNGNEEPITCASCLTSLRYILSFIKTCIDVEEKINTFLQIEGTNGKHQIDLNSVQQLIIKPILNDGGSDEGREKIMVKVEVKPDYSMEIDNAYIKQEEIDNAYIKQEEIEVKSEPGRSERFQEPTLPQVKLECLNPRKQKKNPSKVKFHKCELCTYETKQSSHLKRHMLTHMKSKLAESRHKIDLLTKNISKTYTSSSGALYKCEVCPYETIYKKRFNRHIMLSHKSNTNEVYKCDICTYETKYRHHLKRHMVVHQDPSEINMYKCALCTYETKYKSAFTKHMIIHRDPSEIQMYKCDSCKYETKYGGDLKKHRKAVHMKGNMEALEKGTC